MCVKVMGVKMAMTCMSMWSESSCTYGISEFCVWVTSFDVIAWYNNVVMRMYFVCKCLLYAYSRIYLGLFSVSAKRDSD